MNYGSNSQSFTSALVHFERALLMELIYRFCRISQPEIGKLVGGLDYAAVSQARGRLNKRLAQDAQARKRFQQIHNSLIQL